MLGNLHNFGFARCTGYYSSGCMFETVLKRKTVLVAICQTIIGHVDEPKFRKLIFLKDIELKGT